MVTRGQKSHKIEMAKGAGTSHMHIGTWKKSKSYEGTIYSSFPNNQVRSKSDIRNTIAHEFGHVLGIEDAYFYYENSEAPENDIMRWNNGYNTKMSHNDVFLFLRAFAYDKWQKWDQLGLIKKP